MKAHGINSNHYAVPHERPSSYPFKYANLQRDHSFLTQCIGTVTGASYNDGCDIGLGRILGSLPTWIHRFRGLKHFAQPISKFSYVVAGHRPPLATTSRSLGRDFDPL